MGLDPQAAIAEDRPVETVVAIAETGVVVAADIIGNTKADVITVVADTAEAEIATGIKVITLVSSATTAGASIGREAIVLAPLILPVTIATNVQGVQNVLNVMRVLTLLARVVPGWK